MVPVMTPVNQERIDNIIATERRYPALRHVPEGMSPREAVLHGVKQYRPDTDLDAVAVEANRVLSVIRQMKMMPQQSGISMQVICPSEAVKSRVAFCLDPADLITIDLLVSQ